MTDETRETLAALGYGLLGALTALGVQLLIAAGP